jgi:hypothetical protein
VKPTRSNWLTTEFVNVASVERRKSYTAHVDCGGIYARLWYRTSLRGACLRSCALMSGGVKVFAVSSRLGGAAVLTASVPVDAFGVAQPWRSYVSYLQWARIRARGMHRSDLEAPDRLNISSCTYAQGNGIWSHTSNSPVSSGALVHVTPGSLAYRALRVEYYPRGHVFTTDSVVMIRAPRS